MDALILAVKTLQFNITLAVNEENGPKRVRKSKQLEFKQLMKI